MAEQFSNDQERDVTSPSVESTPGTAPRASSRLSVLIAFIAGAFAAWIIITANVFG